VLHDVSLRVLPVDAAEITRMLAELRGFPLLTGARGSRPANLEALARVIARLGDAAASLGSGLRSLEVNPLWVSGDQIEALDVLVVTEPAGPPDTPPDTPPEPPDTLTNQPNIGQPERSGHHEARL